jgi:hypothetical protein
VLLQCTAQVYPLVTVQDAEFRIGKHPETSRKPALSPPRSPDREGLVQGLDIHEQDAAVGGEGRAAEFLLVLRVGIAGQDED